jgi:predicted ATPase
MKIGKEFRNKTRWMPLVKDVVYLDFRGELPAYEKFMQHPATRDSKKDLEDRKEWLRERSAKVRIALEGKHKKDTYYNRKVIHEIVTLTDDAVGEIGEILGRNYSSIRMIRHDYFERPGWTVELTTAQHVYSEAYAGSGEFAVIVMVHQILSAPKSSLILLDEPETSLHPASQEKLMAFLFRRSLQDKHQVVLATHSPHMIRPLPEDAIKLLTVDPADGKVHLASQENSQTDAFFRLGSPKEGKLTIFVEDSLAAALLAMMANSLGQAKFERLEFKAYPGGASEIKKRLIPHLAQTGRDDAVVILDGDMRPSRGNCSWTVSDSRNLIDPTTVVDNDIAAAFADCFSDGMTMDISLNGGNDPNIASHVIATQRATLEWVEKNVYFLPGSSPEELVCELLDHPFVSSKEAKEFFVFETARELGLPDFRHNEISAERIFETQVRALAKLDLSDGNWQALRAEITARL